VATITEWLASLGLSEYAQRFAENDIDITILRHLTDQDLKEIGVSLGHRRKILASIAELAGAAPTRSQPAAPPEPKTRDDAERRQLTVMFTDLVGSTALSTKLDPEDLRSVIGAYHKCVAQTIGRFGGFVARYMGDGVLIYFGYPQAHEDDAERAVRGGLALIEAIGKLGSVAQLQVRIGVGTGLVVVGDLVGSGEAQERGVVGETPNLAARLQAGATPGTIAIDPTTRRLLGGLFEYRDLGGIEAKGFANRVQAYEVARPSMVESRFEALRTTTTPLIGREEEIDLLLRRWDQAKRGEGCVVLVAGEPGIGKSRIAETILERLSNEPHTRLRYFCSPHHQHSALYPSITQLERAAGFQREDPPEQRLDKLEAVLAKWTNDPRQAAPLIADLLSISTGERYPPLALTPQKRREKTLRALLAHVEGLAARLPVLMLFEDLHWSDPTTRELLDLLIDRVSALCILLIVTFRPEFTPQWISRSHVTLLTLNRLRHRQRTEMITRVTGGKSLPKDIADQIVDRTDGVPLFIEELTKSVVESGIVTEAGDHYTVTGPIVALAIPATLQGSLLARLDRLAPAREVAQIAAALGRSFSHELINAVATMPHTQLDDALDQLVRAELIFRTGMPPDAEYSFKHALVRDAAYGTLLRSRRLQMHGRIAAILEERFSEIVDSQPEVLAWHCAEAGLVEKAVGYSLEAGRQATARSAMAEAAAQLRKGLDLISDLPESTERYEQEIDLQIALAFALRATKGLGAPEVADASARARDLCDHLHHPSRLGSVLVEQFSVRLGRGEFEEAEHHAEELRQLSDVWNDARWKFIGLTISGCVSFYLGKFIDARAYYESALSLFDPAYRDFASVTDDGYVSALIHLSRALLCLGYVDQARFRRDQALAEAPRVPPANVAIALRLAWWCDWAIEGMKAAQSMLRSAEEALAISGEQGLPFASGAASIMRGWCLAAMGQGTQGIQLLLQGLDLYHDTSEQLLLPFYLMLLAETYANANERGEALNRLAEAAEMIETTQERWAGAEIHRLRGTLLLATGDHIAAQDSYYQALAVARLQSAKFWELRAALDLARLWRDQGKHTDARNLLAPIYGWFIEGLDTPVLKEAKALLEQLAA
jgi:class 3 adenylate cyclase/tetratricopeptide (TPR) repeat protein